MITCSIDLKMIDLEKTKVVTRKNGTQARFCDLVLIETPDSAYGDYMVKQDTTKEERDAGVKTPILGNGKVLQRK